MDFFAPIFAGLFLLGILIAVLFLLTGLYGYTRHRNHKKQEQYITWIVYSVMGLILLGILYYAIRDMLGV